MGRSMGKACFVVGVCKLPPQGRKDMVLAGSEWQARAGTGPRAMDYRKRHLWWAQDPDSWLSQCSELGGSWEPLPWTEAWCCQQGDWQCLSPFRLSSPQFLLSWYQHAHQLISEIKVQSGTPLLKGSWPFGVQITWNKTLRSLKLIPYSITAHD